MLVGSVVVFWSRNGGTMSPYLRIPTRFGQKSTYRGPPELPDLPKVQWNPQLPSLVAFEAFCDSVAVAWRGASAKGNWRQARMVWDGYVRLTGAQISDASGYAFDTPDEGLGDWTETVVNWRSFTAGDWDGVVLQLDGSIEPDARLESARARHHPRQRRTRSPDAVVGRPGPLHSTDQLLIATSTNGDR